MTTSTIKAADLGKCYAKADGGFYRLYKVDGFWTIYLVTSEGVAFGGYISDKDNFEMGVDALKEESYYAMEALREEFGF